MVALPYTTIQSAAVGPANPGICRITAITTHPPAGDKITIWIAILTSNWNGRFLGTGGGGFVGGMVAGVNHSAMQPERRIPATSAAAAASLWVRMAI